MSTATDRRHARERALSLLYEAEIKGVGAADVLAELAVEPQALTTTLVKGVSEHRDEVDEVVRRFAKDWSLERMPVLDLALLRIGVYELLHRPDVPAGVVISEAVELASQYSTEESSRFVNGMLSRIAETVRTAAPRP